SRPAPCSPPRTTGRPVLTPAPIPERWQTTGPVPSSAIETNASGLSVQPFGIPSRPYFLGSWALTVDGKPTASTRPPSDMPLRNRRRLTLASTTDSPDDTLVRAVLIAHLPSPPPA